MKLFILIFIILISLISFQTNFDSGDKVVMSISGHSTDLFIGKTTTKQILSEFGKTKIETNIWKFTGKTQKRLFGKRQTMEYKNKGIIFIFKGNGIASKRSVVKDTCLLDEIVITSPNYCIDNICLGTSKSAIERRLGNGTYGIRNGVTDSTKLYYPKSGLTLTFDNGKKSGKLIKIGRSETRAYFLYRQKQAYKKMGNIR